MSVAIGLIPVSIQRSRAAKWPIKALLLETVMLKWRNPFRALAEMSDGARICLATGAGALLLALLGAVVNLFVGNWFQAEGMAVVGVFYLALFVASYPPRGAAALGATELLKPANFEYREKRGD